MSTKIQNTKSEPSVDDYPKLKAWLEEHGAEYTLRLYDGARRVAVEVWNVGEGRAIVTLYADKLGWDVATGLRSNRVDDSIADAEVRLGLRDATVTRQKNGYRVTFNNSTVADAVEDYVHTLGYERLDEHTLQNGDTVVQFARDGRAVWVNRKRGVDKIVAHLRAAGHKVKEDRS